MHSGADPLGNEISKFCLPLCAASALAQGSICHYCQVAGTTLSSFIGKKVRFLGLKLVILLSKMGKRAGDSRNFLLIWQLPIGIYEGFMKVIHLPKFAQRSYKRFKKHKIEKKINGLCQIRTWDLLLPRPPLFH